MHAFDDGVFVNQFTWTKLHLMAHLLVRAFLLFNFYSKKKNLVMKR